MNNNLIWFYIGMPLLGFLFGSFKFTRIITNRTSFIIVLVVSVLLIFNLVSKISFNIDWLDEIVIICGLIGIGYTGSRVEGIDIQLKTSIIKVFRKIVFVFYTTLPISLFGLLIILFSDDFIGHIVHVEDFENHRIKLRKIHSNFVFAGYQVATVYDKIFLLEYPIEKYDLGNYSENGLNMTITSNEGKEIFINQFRYDEISKNLILYKYSNGKFLYSKSFKN